jgi:cytochrome c
MVRVAPLFLVIAAMVAAPALAQDADLVDQGARVFKRCAACHRIGPDAENTAGPSLTGVIGRTAGTAEDFPFSAAMEEAGADGLVWDDDNLMAYLEKPNKLVKGTKMAFTGISSEDDRRAVIAYIAANGGKN